MLQTTIDPEVLKDFMERAIQSDREEMKNITNALEKFSQNTNGGDEQLQYILEQTTCTFTEVGNHYDDALRTVLTDQSSAVESCDKALGLLEWQKKSLEIFGFTWNHFASPVVKNRVSDLDVARSYRHEVMKLLSDPKQQDNQPLQNSAKAALEHSNNAISKFEELSTKTDPNLRLKALLDLDNCAASLNEAFTYRK